MRGIDVSAHNGAIDWAKVKADGVEFAIIRAGYGKSKVDKRFIDNICGAHTAGLKIGIYWFMYALTEADAIMNAEKLHETIGLYKDIIDMRVWADWEYDSDKYATEHGATQTKKSRTDLVEAFLRRLSAKGYDVGVYANPDYIKSKFEWNRLEKYPLWLAHYVKEQNTYQPMIWQHSSKGSVPGINGNVDLDICYQSVTTEPIIEYYRIPQYTLIDALNKVGADSSFANRKKIALKNGIVNYTGTAEQNLLLLEKLMTGKLIK